jgi:hypothetical protein
MVCLNLYIVWSTLSVKIICHQTLFEPNYDYLSLGNMKFIPRVDKDVSLIFFVHLEMQYSGQHSK